MKYSLLKNKLTGDRSIRNNKTGELVIENENPEKYLELRLKAIANIKRAQKNEVYADLGLVRVRGAVTGKIYWE